MKTKGLIVVLLVFLSVSAMAQRKNFQSIDSSRTEVYTSISFGKDLFGNNFSSQIFGVDYAQKLNNKTTLYVGANIFNVSGVRDLVDKSPRKTTTNGSLYVGATYQFNDKLIVHGDIFFNTIYNSIGANIDMTYKMGENSFLTLSATVIRSKPSTYNQAVPYWYYDALQPSILGY